jgi:putative acyl-CoA dehydrogenase
VEESILPRLYREAPVNSIWEGSGNVNALDVLRAMRKEPDSVQAFLAEVDSAHGMDHRLDRSIEALKKDLSDTHEIEARARDLVERMAIVLQASLLVRHGDPAVAELFCASRLAREGGLAFGTLKPTGRFGSVIERHRPRCN